MTVQDIIQQYGREYLRRRPDLSLKKTRVLKDLAACRTGAYGTHLRVCDECGYQERRMNSCRNRHCATCSGPARAEWLEALLPTLLPTSYFQVVFTLPHELIPLTLTQGQVLYPLLFRVAWATLQQLADDPRHLGAQLGALAVLHTWNQELQPHPHVHFVLPAGGLSRDGTHWVSFRRGKPKRGKSGQVRLGAYYFVPHKVISRLFRGKFLAALRAAYDSGELSHALLPESWRAQASFEQRCRALSGQDWVVYQQPPPPDLEPAALVKYLARYVSGMAISDQRLVSSEHGQVTFTVKNRAQNGRSEERTVSAADFLSRYLQHVLPSGLTRVRCYGIWSCRNSAKRELCRALLSVEPAPAPSSEQSKLMASVTGFAESVASIAAPLVSQNVTAAEAAEDIRSRSALCRRCGQSGVAVLLESEAPRWVVRSEPLCTTPAPRPAEDCLILIPDGGLSTQEILWADWSGSEWVLSILPSELAASVLRDVSSALSEETIETERASTSPVGRDSS